MINFPKEHHIQDGFLILDELPVSILPYALIKLLTPPSEYPSHVDVKWLKPTGGSIQISLIYAKYKFPDGKQTFLYGIPEAISRAVEIEQLESPIKIIGFVVIIDITHIENFASQVVKKFSAIRWAKKYDLPIIIAVINSGEFEKSVEKLSEFIDLSPSMPVVWHDGDIDLDLVTRTVNIVYKYI